MAGEILRTIPLLKDKTIVTIASGAVTITQGYHAVAAESGTTDDLATINIGGSVVTSGTYTYRPEIIITADTGDTITVKHGTGNIQLNGAADFELSGSKSLKLVYDGTNWVDVGAGGGASTTTMVELVARTQLVSNTTSISLSSISALYAELFLVMEMRTDDTGGNTDSIDITFNSDTGSNYNRYGVSFFGTTPTTTANESLAAAQIRMVNAASNANSPTGMFGYVVMRIVNYTDTSRARQAIFEGFNNAANSSGNLFRIVGGGTWKNTAAAISSIQIAPAVGTNIVTGSSYALYGIGSA